MPFRWAELTTEDVAQLAERQPVAAVPLGAIEQHGPHLPLATDTLIGEGLLAAAAQRLGNEFPLLILPTLTIGASREHASFAGTLSFSALQMQQQIIAFGEGLARAGLQRLVLFNAHGGNIGWMDEPALELRQRLGLLVVKASYMRFEAPEDMLAAAELRDGLHGGQAETAMLLHLAPQLVRMDRARNFAPSRPRKGPLAPQGEAAWAWLAEDLQPAGVVGNAGAATAKLGQQLVDHYAQRLAVILEETRELEWVIERRSR